MALIENHNKIFHSLTQKFKLNDTDAIKSGQANITDHL